MNDNMNAVTDLDAELKLTLAEIEEVEREMRAADELLEILFDHLPHGVAIASPDGALRMNKAANEILGAATQPAPEPSEAQAVRPEEWSSQFGLFLEDGVTPHPSDTLPLYRALVNREYVTAGLRVKAPQMPQGVWIEVIAKPLKNGSAIAVFRDVTRAREVEQNLIAKNRELAAREQQNQELIGRLRLTLDALSTPVLELGPGILAVPIIGVVDTQRSASMTEKILTEVVRARARFVVLDLTGVAVIDTSTADRLLKLAGALRLLGSECVVSGIQPAVAQTLVGIEVELGAMLPHRDLEHALEHCMGRA